MTLPEGTCDHSRGSGSGGLGIRTALDLRGPGWQLGLLAFALLFAGGCKTECRDLCSTWYDYQRDVCDALDTNDDRVGCIADYKTRLVSDQELEECASAEQNLLEVLELSGAERSCMCDGDRADCPQPGDDDDSSQVETRR